MPGQRRKGAAYLRILGARSAGSALQLRYQSTQEIDRDVPMSIAFARHHENIAIKKSVAFQCRTLHGEVLIHGL